MRASSSIPAAASDAGHGNQASASLPVVDQLVEELASHWRRGEHILIEEYLTLHPWLMDHPESALELIYEEILLRQENGQEIVLEDFLRRFPQWQRQLQTLLECHQLLARDLAVPRFPQAGEYLGDFHLLAELGRGSHGCVFLATQPSLGDRPVVLKISPRSGEEHLSLARLQHTHIVPLYSAHDFPAKELLALCLPYFGGATLAKIISVLQHSDLSQRSGWDLVQALQQAQATAPLLLPVTGPACQFLAKASYTEAVCWIGACLADALHYAHERGIVHLDIKPSNVLLAADGQPMLLDFHLARAPLSPGKAKFQSLGGTPGYMAPEHVAALAAIKKGHPIPSAVDGQADIYALGLSLYEMAGGSRREISTASSTAQALRQRNPQVSPGMADILSKCLEDSKDLRYGSAHALAQDLRRHIADMPLRGVANRSWMERWQKWRRRRPYALLLLGLSLVVALGGYVFFKHINQQNQLARAAFQKGRDYLDKNQHAPALDALHYGLALAEDWTGDPELARQIRLAVQRAERGEAIEEIHNFVDGIRPLYGIDHLPVAQARIIEAHCRNIWRNRRLIVRHLDRDTEAAKERQTHLDLLDLAILWANLHVRLAAGGDQRAAHQEALEVLAEAEILFSSSCVLHQERQVHTQALGIKKSRKSDLHQERDLMPRHAWEHYALGRAYLQVEDYTRALEQLDRALELQPQDLWTHFYKGRCAFQQEQFAEASASFATCIALAPQCAWCYYNRGLAGAQMGRLTQALCDYDRALQLDPTLAAATLQHGITHYLARRYTVALADFEQARRQGIDAAVVLYHQALVYLAQQDRKTALDNLQQALRHNPKHSQARQLLAQIQSNPGERPQK